MNSTHTTPAASTAFGKDNSVRASVNEQQFFASMKHIFASGFSFIGEVMQNARRAGATAVHFELDPEKAYLRVSDDGCGIEDFQTLIALCDTGWNEDIQLTDKPFGMGLFSLFFAAKKVVIRSRGLRLDVCLDDIVQRRSLTVTPDDRADRPEKGAALELHELSSELLHPTYYGEVLVPGSRLRRELCDRAKGFPIEVFMNGEALPRPHAMSALPDGVPTEVGFISFKGVTHSQDGDIPHPFTLQMYLQGLPIGYRHGSDTDVVIHLDSTRFSARMPDRSELFDRADHDRAIYKRINTLAVQFLAQTKSGTDPKTFVQRYWRACSFYQCEHLLNDIPWVPTNVLMSVDQVHFTGAEAFLRRKTIANGIELVSKADVESGWINIWRDAPYGCGHANLLVDMVGLKVMQNLGIFTLSDKLPEGHWLHSSTPSFDDLDFSWTPSHSRGSVNFFSNLGTCTLHLADGVRVQVSSRTDPSFAITTDFDQGWLMVPDDPQQAFETFGGDAHLHCYLMNGSYPDEPVDALSDYMDEDDHYREEWRDDALKTWWKIVSAMRGSSLADLVEQQLRELELLTIHQHRQLCLVRTVGNPEQPRANVIDLSNDEFWMLMAKRLDPSQTDPGLIGCAQSLKFAFNAASRVGQDDEYEVISSSPSA